MNGKAQPVIGLVADFIISERNIAYSKIVKIPAVGRLKTCHCDLGFRIKLLRDPASNGIEFYAIQPTVLHRLRQHPEEIADAHGRLQNISGFEAHLSKGIIDSPDDCRAGIVGIQGRGPRHFILLLRKQGLQLCILFCPVVLIGIKGICKTAPADIPGKDFLFFRCSITVFRFQPEKRLNGFDVPCKLFLRTAFPEMIIGDAEIDVWKSFCGNFLLHLPGLCTRKIHFLSTLLRDTYLVVLPGIMGCSQFRFLLFTG